MAKKKVNRLGEMLSPIPVNVVSTWELTTRPRMFRAKIYIPDWVRAGIQIDICGDRWPVFDLKDIDKIIKTLQKLRAKCNCDGGK